MIRILVTGAFCLTLGACATGAPQTLAVCNGLHRRPANPNGSVLVARSAAPTPATPQRTASLGASYAPCGARA